MGVRKIAISLPEEVLRKVDRLAKRTHTTRSGCITRVLSEVSHASTQAEITEQINLLFSDPTVAKEQTQVSDDFWKAASSGLEGAEW